jgi:hypothetical protein
VVPDGVPVAELGAAYERACARSREIAAGYALDHLGAHPHLGPVSLRWVYVHMIEETARHVGHADILREQTDGATGVLGRPPALSRSALSRSALSPQPLSPQPLSRAVPSRPSGGDPRSSTARWKRDSEKSAPHASRACSRRSRSASLPHVYRP